MTSGGIQGLERLKANIEGRVAEHADRLDLYGDYVSGLRDSLSFIQQELDHLKARAAQTGERDARQQTVSEWCIAAFGADQGASIPQRGLRLAEEAIEAAQAAGCEREMIHGIVDFVYDRPVGDLGQELGGVGVTTLALAASAKLSAEAEEAREVARVLSKPIAHFTARNQAKNDAGFLAKPRTGA